MTLGVLNPSYDDRTESLECSICHHLSSCLAEDCEGRELQSKQKQLAKVVTKMSPSNSILSLQKIEGATYLSLFAVLKTFQLCIIIF